MFAKMSKLVSAETKLVLCLLVSSLMAAASAGNFINEEVDITWGDNRAKILGGGRLLSLSLDKYSGSGFQSKQEYLFGRVDMQIKLVAGNSAGTVTTYYVRNCTSSTLLSLHTSLMHETECIYILG